MNYSRDSEYGAAPGVMGHLACSNPGCSCNSDEPFSGLASRSNREVVTEYNNGVRWQNKPGRKFDNSYYPAAKVEREAIEHAWVKYAFIKRKSEKAVLFAFNSKNGLFEHWVPISLIAGLQEDPNRVKIATWFIKRESLDV